MILSGIAILLALGSLGWQIWTYFHSNRSDVRVTVRTEPVAIDQKELVLVVVATNHGTTTETVEKMGLRFVGDPNEAMNESSVIKTVDEPLPPSTNVRLEWDLGRQRFAVGRTHTGFASLATGIVIESNAEDFGAYSLFVAGLLEAVRPVPTIEEVERSRPGS